MIDQRKERFAGYFRYILNTLALRDWSFVILAEQPEGRMNPIASIEPIYGRKLAYLRLSEAFLDKPEEEQKHLLVHEALHLHFAAAWTLADEELPPAAQTAFNLMAEYAIDGLADGIAHFFRLPSNVENR